MSAFRRFLLKVRGKDWICPERLLAIDPGKTTGWALFVNGELCDCGEIRNSSVKELEVLFNKVKPTVVVCEDYKVYAWKAAAHTWSDLPVSKLIGTIETLCYLRNAQFTTQMAITGKMFCTNKRLEEWNIHVKGGHAEDAIRHGCYYLLFSNARVPKV